MAVLNKYAIRFLSTDLQGMAETGDLKPGIYHVCGVFAMGKRTRIWNVRIDLKPGENSLTLDNKNMMEKKK